MLLGPPGSDTDVPVTLSRSSLQRNVLWPDGSRSLALAAQLDYGPVVHLMDEMDGQPWAGGNQRRGVVHLRDRGVPF